MCNQALPSEIEIAGDLYGHKHPGVGTWARKAWTVLSPRGSDRKRPVVPETKRIWGYNWHCEITDTVFGIELFKRATRNALGMRPPGWSTQRSGPRKLWFDKVNIFTANLLVVPVYWELMTHWLLCSIRIYDSITAGGTRRHRAVYDRMREMLMWEHKGQYNGIPLADSWAQFSSDSVIIVPQQDNTVDCGIYTIANAENLVRNLEPAPTSYTAASAAVGSHQDCQSVESPATTLAAPAIATPLQPKFRHAVGAYRILPQHESNLKGLLLPAKTLAVTSRQAELMWHCNTLFMEQADKPVGPFTCPLAEWEAAAGRSCKSDEWPAAREGWSQRKFGTYVFASDRALAAVLRLGKDTILRYLHEEGAESEFFVRLKEDYRAARLIVDPVAETFDFEAAIFPNFQWFQIASHEAMIYQFAGEISSAVRYEFADVDDAPAALLQLADDIGSAYLWVTYVAFLSGFDISTVYERMKAGEVRWPSSEVEDMWAAYLQVVVPDVAALPPFLD
ncbi:hypothetical protein B0H17DRAFT_1236325 [Mycena rosella]|uniref:Ubiquitin-like protease family profile domain-containing protein n=1 Tax=Mycena rosella TaxID=1033263 RepID=A0AAD7GB25_MYCRO|nr:hypothetical protein B0H17DRAFT_1236325 [Mycena rosella]